MRIRIIHRSVPNPAITEPGLENRVEEVDVDEKSDDEKTTPQAS